jgi:hypothetical protein
MTQMGIVTIVMAIKTLRWDGIILLSLVGSRIEIFMLVLKIMVLIAMTGGQTCMTDHIQIIIRSS